MAKKKAFNEYEIRGETTAIFLKKRNGQVFETLIDTNYLERVKGLNLHWHVTFAPNTGTYYVKAMQRYTGEDGKRKGRSMYLHIEIMNPKHYPSIYIDHFDHDTLNNLKSNLRISINEDNVKNRKGKNSNNTTGYRNVSYIKAESKYVVQIQIDGKNTQLRWFDDVDEAGEYAEKMREKYYGNFAGAS